MKTTHVTLLAQVQIRLNVARCLLILATLVFLS
jgi:hypothetical protein